MTKRLTTQDRPKRRNVGERSALILLILVLAMPFISAAAFANEDATRGQGTETIVSEEEVEAAPDRQAAPGSQAAPVVEQNQNVVAAPSAPAAPENTVAPRPAVTQSSAPEQRAAVTSSSAPTLPDAAPSLAEHSEAVGSDTIMRIADPQVPLASPPVDNTLKVQPLPVLVGIVILSTFFGFYFVFRKPKNVDTEDIEEYEPVEIR